jgi:hypothetical protein
MIDLAEQTFIAVLAFVAMLDEIPAPGDLDPLVMSMAALIVLLLGFIVGLLIVVWRRPGEPRVDPLDPYAEAFGEIVVLPANMRCGLDAPRLSPFGGSARSAEIARGDRDCIPSTAIAARSSHHGGRDDASR